MNNLLHIDSSPLGEHSASRDLTADLAKALAPAERRAYLDLAANPLPHWTPEEAAANQSLAVLEQFLAADRVVIGVPMYNFGIPSQLKAWLDRIAVAGKTFRYTEKGPEGLAKGKTVWLVSTRGGSYPEASGMDFQEAYLRAVFGFLGVDDVRVVRAEGLAMGPVAREQAMASARTAIAAQRLKAAA